MKYVNVTTIEAQQWDGVRTHVEAWLESVGLRGKYLLAVRDDEALITVDDDGNMMTTPKGDYLLYSASAYRPSIISLDREHFEQAYTPSTS